MIREQASANLLLGTILVGAGLSFTLGMQLAHAYDIVTPVAGALDALVFQSACLLAVCVVLAIGVAIGVVMESSESRDRARDKDVEISRLRARNRHLTWMVTCNPTPTAQVPAFNAPTEPVDEHEIRRLSPDAPDWLSEPSTHDYRPALCSVTVEPR